MPQPYILIAVVNFNNWKDTLDCLESLSRRTYKNSGILLIDNGSTDGSQSHFAKLQDDITVHCLEKNHGWTAAVNHALEYGREHKVPFTMVMNEDMLVEPDFIEPMIEVLLADERVAATCPKIYYEGDRKKIWYAGTAQRWYGGFQHIGMDQTDDMLQQDASRPGEMPYAVGTMLLFNMKAIEHTGGFDNDIFIYWDEAVWAYQAHRCGYKTVYVPRSVVYHKVVSAPGGFETKFYLYLQARNAFIFASKQLHNFEKINFFLLFTLFLCYRMLFLITKKNMRGAVATLHGVIDFYRGGRGEDFLVERGLVRAQV